MIPRTERQRIERVVQSLVVSTAHPTFKSMIRKAAVVDLLLRELAKERGRVRRIVKAQPSFGAVSDGDDGEWILRTDLLAALYGRKG